MGESILITGVPGAGKSTVCTELERRGYTAYDIEHRDNLFTMFNEETGEVFDDFDPNNLEAVKKSEWVCDKEALKGLIDQNEEGTVFYCGTATNIHDILPLFDKVFLLQVEPDVLLKRLKNRGINPFGQRKEIREWVLSWKEEWEGRIREKGATVIEANGEVEETVDSILNHLE